MPAVMLVAVLGMVAAMMLSGMARNPMSFIFPLMMIGSMTMMLQPGGQDVDEIRRSFHRHLDALGDGVRRARRTQQEEAQRRHPHPQALWTLGAGGVEAPGTEPGIVRIGTAVQVPEDPLEIPVDVPPEDLEPVCAMSLRSLAIRYATVDAPVAVDLREFPVVAVTGPGAPDQVRAMQGALVQQDPAALTVDGPHDRWLPHDGPLTVRFRYGADPGPGGPGPDTSGPDTSGPDTRGAVNRPARCTVVADPDVATEEAARSTGLLLHSDGEMLSAWTVDGWRPFATADRLSDVELASLCRARCARRQETSILDLPGGDLRAPVGWAGRSPVYLDIRESARGGIGPHGLCIGATGSGKSELLKAVVTSFAHHHAATELNFVLVDFKGGAAFAGLEQLPHTSAMITNLSDEEVLVDRMQDALLGEMHRRQESLRSSGLTTATDYNHRHPGEMPSLLIVVDEFSELLHARPEFAEVFAAVGRLGRSLGLHLLLASQRLEEGRLRGLESHLSYRIALRTFSAAESRALIGSTAAHDLPTAPGAAILAEASGGAGQTRFQSAYVSGPEIPTDQRIIRELGVEPETTGTTMDLVVGRLAGPNLNPIWLEPLPTELPASRVLDTGALRATPALCVPVGLEDLPFDGVQRPFRVDLRRRHWAIVGSPGTGKTMVLRTLAVGLALTSPGVAVYVVDPGGSLASLARLPQVAAVVGVDLIDRMLSELEQDAPDGVTHRVVLIDGVDALGEADRRLATIAAGGLERGVHIVVTAMRWMFRPGLRDLLTGQVELRLPPPDSNFRDVQRTLPDTPGRGVSPDGRQVQIAGSDEQAVEHARRISTARDEPDRQMRLLPQMIHRDDIGYAPVPGKLLLGLGGPALGPVTWDFRTSAHLTVVGQARSGVTMTLRGVIAGADGAVELLVTDARRGLLGMPGYRSPVRFAEELAGWVEVLRSRIPDDVTALSPQILRDRSWWSGPELMVVVDDLDHSADLVSTLDLLVPLLPHAADIGLHLVTARRSAVMGRNAYTPLLQGVRDSSAWVLLSAPREDGPVVGQVLGPRPPGRGAFLQGEVVELQVAVSGRREAGGRDTSETGEEATEEAVDGTADGTGDGE